LAIVGDNLAKHFHSRLEAHGGADEERYLSRSLRFRFQGEVGVPGSVAKKTDDTVRSLREKCHEFSCQSLKRFSKFREATPTNERSSIEIGSAQKVKNHMNEIQ
jgi:hypothetical protein